MKPFSSASTSKVHIVCRVVQYIVVLVKFFKDYYGITKLQNDMVLAQVLQTQHLNINE